MRSTIINTLLIAVLSSVLTVAAVYYLFPVNQIIIREKINSQLTSDIYQNRNFQRNITSFAPTSFTHAADKALKAVVSVTARKNTEDFWGKYSPGESTGSGVIISNDGYIITNNHVIENTNQIKVLLEDMREYDAQIVGTDPTTDMALLKIDGMNLPYLIFADSDTLMVGEWVLAVGNPFRLSSTVTAGIVSAKGRNINILNREFAIESFIQTDAVVNPGNSGGALVNTNGELVGINTAIITESGRYEGYSFAIPANLVLKVVEDLKEYGQLQRGLLGVTIRNLDWAMARKFGFERVKGVIVERVNPQSSAYDAGLKRGDVILTINMAEVNSFPQLQEQVGRYRPGDKVTVGFYRDGEVLLKELVLKNSLNTTDIISVRTDATLVNLGFELRNLTKEEENIYKQKGVVVASIFKNSIIESTNMDPGFIITAVNDKPVQSVDDLIFEIEKAEAIVTLSGYYNRYKGKYFYEFSKAENPR